MNLQKAEKHVNAMFDAKKDGILNFYENKGILEVHLNDEETFQKLLSDTNGRFEVIERDCNEYKYEMYFKHNNIKYFIICN